ncbi:hypothetical protein [uncultured Idiomarina sp.]|uniref:hypothetical protein n=1 Tax=uncultured Idiomarina sp. TaxID=352961 RepID=UPI002594DDF3|nr:hypothetical protein [uncultured Idiomarina sp.]
MKFQRTQKREHTFESAELEVSYDRLTTKFELKEKGTLIYSAFLGLLPFRRSKVVINDKTSTITIFWVIVWFSKLRNSDGSVISELLPQRRRKSIGVLAYIVLITTMKISIGLMAELRTE